jgi:transposase
VRQLKIDRLSRDPAEVEPGRKQVLIVEDWAEIRRLRKSEGVSISEIARLIGCSRNTVKAALASEVPPRYERAGSGSLVDAYEPRIRELLTAFPRMPATVIAERIEWPYSIRTLSTRVAELRPIYLPPDPASRTSYLAGEIAQCDFWFPPIRLPVGFGQTRTPTQLPVLTMITGYARWALGVLVPTRRAEDLYAGWWRLLQQLGAVPRVLVWDGEAAIRQLKTRSGATHLADHRGLRSIEGGAVRGHLQQGEIDRAAVEDRSVAAAGDGDEASLGIEDALRRVAVGTGDGVNRGAVDPPQRARFFNAVRWCGQGYRPAIEHLIDQQIDQRRGLFRGHVDGADMALGFGTDVPRLPDRPGLLHGGQHPVGGLRDPVGVGQARGFCGGTKCRGDHGGDGAAATEHR